MIHDLARPWLELGELTQHTLFRSFILCSRSRGMNVGFGKTLRDKSDSVFKTKGFELLFDRLGVAAQIIKTYPDSWVRRKMVCQGADYGFVFDA